MIWILTKHQQPSWGYPTLTYMSLYSLRRLPLIIPRKVEWGYTGFTLTSVLPSVGQSVRQSVCRQGFRIFLKKKLLAQFISYLASTLNGTSLLTAIHFRVSNVNFGHLLCWSDIWPKMGFPEFLKELLAHFISYLAFTLWGRVFCPTYIFLLLPPTSFLWWPNIWPKMACWK